MCPRRSTISWERRRRTLVTISLVLATTWKWTTLIFALGGAVRTAWRKSADMSIAT